MVLFLVGMDPHGWGLKTQKKYSYEEDTWNFK